VKPLSWVIVSLSIMLAVYGTNCTTDRSLRHRGEYSTVPLKVFPGD